MLIHSVIPQNLMFPPEMPASQIKPCRYGYVECIANNGGFTVSRLISTNPLAYLDPNFAPGSKFE
ncbi:MAG: hypothetical protein IKV41_05010 [Oscillospiraceae bacterium]|nr:hypothetical protein [Oscillospiraceae bacterium]